MKIWTHPQSRAATEDEILAHHAVSGHEVDIRGNIVDWRPIGTNSWIHGRRANRYSYADGRVSYNGEQPILVDLGFDGSKSRWVEH